MPQKVLNTSTHSDSALTLAKTFAHRIVGQPEATDALINVLDKFESGFYDRTKPIASLLFLGPTGTGKTATVEALAEGLFDSSTRMFKIDCGEFQHSHEVAKLLGSPPGYLGHRETHPLITNAKIKEMQLGGPALTVVLFDEIEKASDSLWNLLLGILDKGTMTLGTNETVDFTSCVIVMTSNVGSKELATKAGNDVLGFLAPVLETSPDQLKDVAVAAARRKFMPEFLNRLDDVVMFNTLTEDNLREILEIELDRLRINLLRWSIFKPLVVVTPSAKRQILVEGFDKKYGARHLKRAVDKFISLPLSRAIAARAVENLDTVIVDYSRDRFMYFVEPHLETNTEGTRGLRLD